MEKMFNWWYRPTLKEFQASSISGSDGKGMLLMMSSALVNPVRTANKANEMRHKTEICIFAIADILLVNYENVSI